VNYENFDCEIRDGVATVTFISPDIPSLADLCDEFVDLLLRLQDDAAVRAVVVSDGLRPFDFNPGVESIAQERCEGEAFTALAPHIDSARRLVTAIQEFGKPLCAAATGSVREAGFGLFLAADFRVASTSATFAAPDVGRGLLPDWGLTHTLPRLVGPSRTLELLWSGRTVGAEEAARMGLVDRVVPDEQWDDEIEQLAQRLCSLPQPAVRLAKLATQQASQFDLTSMLSFEFEAQQQCWDSRETTEGMAAFLDDRSPDFRVPTPETEDDE
jgi:enoyl-CoA hydratase/carnithine racemase